MEREFLGCGMLPFHFFVCYNKSSAAIAQLVERIHGKDEVTGSSPVGGSMDIYYFVSANF